MRISDWSSDVCSSDLQFPDGVSKMQCCSIASLLAHAPGETRISDIILAVDEPIRATRCTPGQPFGCRRNKSRCQTHDLWEELGNQKIGRASCRDRECRYVSFSVVAVT